MLSNIYGENKAALAAIVSGKRCLTAATSAANYTTSLRVRRPGAAKVCLEHSPLASRSPVFNAESEGDIVWEEGENNDEEPHDLRSDAEEGKSLPNKSEDGHDMLGSQSDVRLLF